MPPVENPHAVVIENAYFMTSGRWASNTLHSQIFFIKI